jgi:hypothetical protein
MAGGRSSLIGKGRDDEPANLASDFLMRLVFGEHVGVGDEPHDTSFWK